MLLTHVIIWIYGYRTVAALMRNTGWQRATEERVKRIWRQEGLKVPEKQTPKGRLWLNDGIGVCKGFVHLTSQKLIFL